METKTCPACHEEIHLKATRCKHCGKNIPAKLTRKNASTAIFWGLVIAIVGAFAIFRFAPACF